MTHKWAWWSRELAFPDLPLPPPPFPRSQNNLNGGNVYFSNRKLNDNIWNSNLCRRLVMTPLHSPVSLSLFDRRRRSADHPRRRSYFTGKSHLPSLWPPRSGFWLYHNSGLFSFGHYCSSVNFVGIPGIRPTSPCRLGLGLRVEGGFSEIWLFETFRFAGGIRSRFFGPTHCHIRSNRMLLWLG